MPETLYQLGKAAEAAGIDPGFLSQRINRGDPVLDEERDINAEGRGFVRMFSLPTILQIAIAQRLRGLGVPFKDGLKAAWKFVLVGGNSVQGDREPGKPFVQGSTLLVHSPAGTGVVNTYKRQGDTSLRSILCDALLGPSNSFSSGQFAVVIVDAGGVYRDVCERLGLGEKDSQK